VSLRSLENLFMTPPGDDSHQLRRESEKQRDNLMPGYLRFVKTEVSAAP
jgi:hypothetical protein